MASSRGLFFAIFVPELDRLEPDEADRLVRNCRLRDLFDRRFARDLLKLVVIAAAAAAGVVWIGRRFAAPDAVVRTLTLVVTTVATAQAINITLRRPMRRHVRRYLAAHGERVCPRCGRDLRDSAAPRCSECRTLP